MRLRAGRCFAPVLLGVWLAAGGGWLAGQAGRSATPLPVQHVEHGPNSEAARKAHYVVLVSLDGFRWDYAKRDGAKHLLEIGKEGVWAPEGMLPSFPSLTFPNHFTIVTGLYPEHHGLVANNFYDERKQAHYTISDPKAVTDGSWYSGVPLWSLAESQGMRTACLFWPGSEAEIAGYRPTYFLHYDEKIGEDERVAQVLDWLKLPEAERPHFITLYFSEPDHEGHEFGPDAPETRAAVRKVDALVGKLKAGLDASKLPVDLVVVSDHGMTKVAAAWITLDQFADLAGFETAGALLYGKTEADRQRVYDQLKKASSEFKVYRRKNVPGDLHFNQNDREGDPVVIATGAYAIRAHGPAAGKPDRKPTAGAHGFDPALMPEMKASFFAEGADIVPGKTVLPFENVNLYPWLAHMLGLHAPKTDGSLNVLAGTLRDDGAEPAQ
ncbi:MAG: ectonucleotide pyrophosphatase/phosphodiesterase [Terracidiphilus sp.]